MKKKKTDLINSKSKDKGFNYHLLSFIGFGLCAFFLVDWLITMSLGTAAPWYYTVPFLVAFFLLGCLGINNTIAINLVKKYRNYKRKKARKKARSH